MAISNTVINTSNTTLYTASGDTMIATMIFCNTSASLSQTITLYLYPNGGSASSSTMIVNSLPVPATETVFFDTERLVLGNGDTLVGIASGATITCTMSTVAI